MKIEDHNRHSEDLRVKLERASGKPLTPDGVELGDLLAILGGLRAAVFIEAGLDPERQTTNGVSLVGIESGSFVPVMRIDQRLRGAVDHVLEAVHRRDPAGMKRSAASAAFSAFAKALELGLVVHLGGRGRSITISELQPFPAPDPAPGPLEVKGTTTLYGECTSAGGVRKPRAKFLLMNETREIEARTTKEIARRLGKRLYELVGVRGEATWSARDWSLTSFFIQEIVEYERASVVQTFAELREAVGDAFDSDASIERLRTLREME